MMNQEDKKAPGAPTVTIREQAHRKAFITPVVEPRGDLQIHFCSGINLWDGTGGTIQCN